jgi:hypothetical protein
MVVIRCVVTDLITAEPIHLDKALTPRFNYFPLSRAF